MASHLLTHGICPRCELNDRTSKLMAIGMNNDLSFSRIPGYRAIIKKSWKNHKKLPCCIICGYTYLVDNDGNTENGWKNIRFTNLVCKI